ncbi:MAG: hypothetical protein AB8I08_06475 [Sandaracinaceae bacterium]
MQKPIWTWVLVTALAAPLGACGGPALVGDVYGDDEARYRVGTFDPEWEPLRVSNNDLAWRHGAHGAIAQINANCDPFQDVPLTSLTNHLLIGFTDRERHDQRIVTLDGRDALRSRYTASLDGVPRELLFYVLKKDECTYDFALVAAPGAGYGPAEAAFERFVAGFSTEVGAAP